MGKTEEIELKKLIRVPEASITNLVTTYLTKDRREIPVNFSASIMKSENGELQGIVCNAGDITERKRAEEALRESEERYRSIFESIQDVYAEVAMDGTILEISPSIQSFSGYAPEEVLGRSLAEFYVYPEQRAALLERLRLEGSVNDYEVVLRHKTGRVVTCSFTVKVVTDAFGTPVKIVGTMRDVTERKRLDDERERLIKKLGALDKMKTDFLNVAYHEMRSPLAPIVGYASLLEQSELNEKQKKYARIIEESAYKLEELIESLLEVTRLEAGKAELSLEKMSIPEIVNNVLERFELQADAKRQTISTVVPEGTEVEGDKQKITAIFDNLISNAIKYTGEKGRIDIVVEDRKEGIRVFVADTGIGIPKEQLPMVFERFYTVDTPLAGKGGLGLGLAIVKGYVKLHGGKVWVTSESGKGSKFWFTLPKRRR